LHAVCEAFLAGMQVQCDQVVCTALLAANDIARADEIINRSMSTLHKQIIKKLSSGIN